MKVKAKTNGWTGVRYIRKGEIFESPVLGRWMELIEDDKPVEVKVEKPKLNKPPLKKKKSTLKLSKKTK